MELKEELTLPCTQVSALRGLHPGEVVIGRRHVYPNGTNGITYVIILFITDMIGVIKYHLRYIMPKMDSTSM